MLKFLKQSAFAAALIAATATPGDAQEMGTPLKGSTEVPLEFLSWIDKDTDWLRTAMDELGAEQAYSVSDVVAEARTVEAREALNRIRSFAYLAAPGLRPPMFDLPVSVGDEAYRCVTGFPKSIAPDIGPMDFAKKRFSADDADQTILDLCRVDRAADRSFTGLTPEAFRSRYFDEAGHLRTDFISLGAKPEFMAEAIDLGFFVTQNDLTGRLELPDE